MIHDPTNPEARCTEDSRALVDYLRNQIFVLKETVAAGNSLYDACSMERDALRKQVDELRVEIDQRQMSYGECFRSAIALRDERDAAIAAKEKAEESEIRFGGTHVKCSSELKVNLGIWRGEMIAAKEKAEKERDALQARVRELEDQNAAHLINLKEWDDDCGKLQARLAAMTTLLREIRSNENADMPVVLWKRLNEALKAAAEVKS